MARGVLNPSRSGEFTKFFFFIYVLSFMVVGLLGLSTRLYAAPVVVTSRATLAGNDFVDWGGFGAPFTVVANPSNVSSNTAAITANVSMPSGQFERRDQSSGGWDGNFAPGDHLLWTESANVGPMIISFNNPVNGAGAQIQADFFGPFTATINAYDASSTLIGSFTINGNSNPNADNSAIFLGVMDTSPTIKRIEYSVSSVFNNDFAINQLDLIDPTASIPTMNEWGMIIFVVLAGLSSMYYIRRQKRVER